MIINIKCLGCNIAQVEKIGELIGASEERQEKALREVLSALSKESYSQSEPELMQTTYKIITEAYNESNPYKKIKEFYNSELMSLYPVLKEKLDKRKDAFYLALKLAAAGNKIDFAASHSFNRAEVLSDIEDFENKGEFCIDHSEKLYASLKRSKKLLYIGDNCGEIVLDRLFIEQIKKDFPDIEITFGVRGKHIVNDITEEDAFQIKLEEISEIISSGSGIPGTILERTSEEFQKCFDEADTVIAKGQGNFEGLRNQEKNGLFFLFLIKCSVIADITKGTIFHSVCMEGKKPLR